jgi:cyclin L
VSEGKYHTLRTRLTAVESEILRVSGFDTSVALPHTLCISYLQALDVFQQEAEANSTRLAKRAFAHLNSALQNPQLLYLTHQPFELACAAIYLAAREVEVKLPGEQWWEVFDTDREKLGFLVVAMNSMQGFVRIEKEKWHGRMLPITVEGLDKAIQDE